MTPELQSFLSDPAASRAGGRDADTGSFLALMVRALSARQVLEVGTSNGYLTLWLADAVREMDGLVTTLERAPSRVLMARENFERAGLSSWIRQETGDAGDFLRTASEGSFRLVFLDSERSEYCGWWPILQRVLAAGGMLVVDKATSHAAEMAPFAALVAATPGFITSLVTQGNGELLILKV